MTNGTPCTASLHEAIFDARLSGDERVRVLLKLLNRQLFPVELPGGQFQNKQQ